MTSQINVGMDLGSYKTAVITSEGRRAVIPTIVGRPKDRVARRLLNVDTVFGDAVWENRHSLDVVRPLAHGNLKFQFPKGNGSQDSKVTALHRESLEQIVDHALGLVGVHSGVAAAAVIGVPACAGAESKELIVKIAERTCRSVMVVSEPFAVAYGIDLLTNAVIIDIGAGTTDICALTGVFPPPEHQLTLSIGGDSIDEAFFNQILSQHPTAVCSLEMLRDVKDRNGSIAVDLPQVELTVVIDGRPETLDVANQLRQSCQLLVEPILNGIKNCLSIWDSETQSRLLQNVILAGGGSRMVGLDSALERLLRKHYYGVARVSRVHDSMFAGATGALKLAAEMPAELWSSIRKAA
jgi:rod shape-determining protein MreB and related proteins